METQRTILVEKAAGIIMSSGIHALKIEDLTNDPQLKDSDLFTRIENLNDILLILLAEFEFELKTFLEGMKSLREDPGSELRIMFKRLYFLFLQKPYYLELIFDMEKISKDESTKNAYTRIRNLAEDYLSSVVNRGKSEKMFDTNIKTKVFPQ